MLKNMRAAERPRAFKYVLRLMKRVIPRVSEAVSEVIPSWAGRGRLRRRFKQPRAATVGFSRSVARKRVSLRLEMTRLNFLRYKM